MATTINRCSDWKKINRSRERFSDPLLTALTIMFGIFLFVVGPMQAAGAVEVHYFGLALGVVLLAAVFIVSGAGWQSGRFCYSIALIVVATALRPR